ncbi:MAG: ATP-binding cassette domain-containing protein [Bacteroidota bacterium]
MIILRSITKRYGNHLVLNGIDAEFEEGRAYGIIGENGAGKSTLFRCICGLESFTGEITTKETHLKDVLGFLPTEPFYFPRMTGREYLTLLCTARGIHPTGIDAKNVFDLPLDDYAAVYSTGMKKKLAFLGLLLQENEVFILDEPFNGVDIESNLLMSEIIRALRKSGKTLLISSHIFSTLSDVCDEILLLRQGVFESRHSKDDFQALENRMKAGSIGNRLDRLGLKS